MKKLIKITSIFLALLIALSCAAFAADETGRHHYLLLGDSIAEGYGVKNSYESCYGKIIADTIGYEYTNYGRAASTSDDLVYNVQNIPYVRNSIAQADIISISIGGNDYLCDSKVVGLVLSALFNVNMGRFNAITENCYNNICLIISTIRELNPDAVIICQTVYSSWFGILGIPYGRATGAVNDCIKRYDSEHPGEIEIVDIAGAMNGKKELLADDTIHPNAAGNVEIAKTLLKKLNDLGLTDKTEIVVNTPGIDYNYYVLYFDELRNIPIGKLVTFIIKLCTGNLF